MADYFNEYYKVNSGLNLLLAGLGMEFSFENFTDQATLFDKVENEHEQPYCFAISFSKFDDVNDDYEVQLSFPFNTLPQTG